MSNLTKEQENIINFKGKNTFINAIPGAGKTFILIEKIVSDINKIMKDEKISSDEIIGFVIITYTKKAANQLKDKLNEKNIKLNLEFNHIGTIDSFVLKNIEKFKNRIIKFYNEKYNDNQVFLKKWFSKNILQKISKQPIEGNTINETLLIRNNIDLFLEWITLFSKDKIYSMNKTEYLVFLFLYERNWPFSNHINSIYKYFYIDEIQDINFVQSLLINSFFGDGNRVFMVGDKHQQLYKFNGADFKYVMKIIKEKECAEFELTRSFRNNEDIAIFSNCILNGCKAKPSKSIEIIKYESMIQLLNSKKCDDNIFVLAHWNSLNVPELKDIFEKINKDSFILSEDLFSFLGIKNEPKFISYFELLLSYWYEENAKRKSEDLDYLLKSNLFKEIDESIFSKKYFLIKALSLCLII